MFEVRIDIPKNRLYLTLEGFMHEPEIVQAAAEVIRQAHRLRRGFSVVNDISAFKPAGPDSAAHIVQAQRSVALMGMGQVVRITNVMAKMQFDKGGRQAGYEGLVATSVREADAMLDKLAA